MITGAGGETGHTGEDGAGLNGALVIGAGMEDVGFGDHGLGVGVTGEERASFGVGGVCVREEGGSHGQEGEEREAAGWELHGWLV